MKSLIKNMKGFGHLKKLKANSIGPRLLLSFLIIVSVTSCVGSLTSSNSEESERGIGSTGNEGFNNTVESVTKTNHGRIIEDAPNFINSNFGPNGDFNTLIDDSTYFITNQHTLTNPCIFYNNNPTNSVEMLKYVTNFECYRVFKERENVPINSPDFSKKWAFNANSSSFLQVHTMGHMNFVMDHYGRLLFHLKDLSGTEKSTPTDLFDDTNNPNFWRYVAGTNNDPVKEILNIFSEGLDTNGSPLIDNAKYDPSSFSLVFGRDREEPKIKYAQDPSIIYHEAGHALNDLLINMRNNKDIGARSALSKRFYEEGGAISEALADYFSYIVNNRPHFAKWAFGRPGVTFDRPLAEENNLHQVSSVFPSVGGELSYPEFINYDPYFPDERVEDIHYAGQIISHFLVALTRDLQIKCFGPKTNKTLDESQMVVLTMIAETLMELGDLTGKGQSGTVIFGSEHEDIEYRVNLNPDFSLDWQRMVNPINYRRFSQTLASKILNYLIVNGNSNSARFCPLQNFDKDDLESILDRYGLLLFETYNTDGNSGVRSISNIQGSTPLGHSDTATKINLGNRVKTELILKENLILDPNTGASAAFVFDVRSDMINILDALNISPSNGVPPQLDYNNGNGQVSPGELIGILPNIYNNSNSIMGGVQILGNDWDHFKDGKPCNNLGDNFPFPSEGAADLTTGEGTPGGCNYTTRENGNDDGEDVHPICFLQIEENGSLIWASQENLLTKIGLDSSQCLDPNDTSSCFIKTVKNYEHSWFSRIDPNKSYADTMRDKENELQFLQSNLVLMEVNPNTPPGTKFNCRMRARFSNCKDCWHDPDFNDDDFLDYEFSGSEPFQIINLQFRVID